MIETNVKILTAKGQSQQISPALYDYICLTSDKRLFYNEAYFAHPQVLNKIALYKEANLYDGAPIAVSSTEIRSFYDRSLKNSEASTQLQRDIQDIFEKAAAQNASDVHISVRNDGCVMKFRTIGELEYSEEYTASHGNAICKAIFMTMCDQQGKNFQPQTRPQEARMKAMYLPDGITGVRIQTSYTDAGYSMICRLLKRIDQSTMTTSKLGYETFQTNLLDQAKSKKGGINIFAGSTGSGKSVSLASILSKIISDSNGKLHIATIENPVEYAIGSATSLFRENSDDNLLVRLQDLYQQLRSGKVINISLTESDLLRLQTLISNRLFKKWNIVLKAIRDQNFRGIEVENLKDLLDYQPFQIRARLIEKRYMSYATQIPLRGATSKNRVEKFAELMGAMMRMDPDVIMIGEVRDSGSLKAARDASLTGHQVWSTVHATTATAIIKRLITLASTDSEKVTDKEICDASVVTSLIAQKLVKKLCPSCSVLLADEPNRISEELTDRLKAVYGEDLSGIRVAGEGCVKCANSKSIGRTVVAEVILVDQKFMELMLRSPYEAEKYWIEDLEGATMMMHGLLKVKRGKIDPFDLEEELEYINIPKGFKGCFDKLLEKYL